MKCACNVSRKKHMKNNLTSVGLLLCVVVMCAIGCLLLPVVELRSWSFITGVYFTGVVFGKVLP